MKTPTETKFDFTGAMIDWARGLSWEALGESTRHNAKRHLIDTLGAILAGTRETVTATAMEVIGTVREGGKFPVPGIRQRFDLLDSIYLAAVAGHALELDDGYRAGSTHPGVTVVPAALGMARAQQRSGRELLVSLVAGYEAVTRITRAAHPRMRQLGFHPTATAGVFGAAVAAALLIEASPDVFRRTLGIAASASAGLFAFTSGGADIKRLHPGHAAREGAFAALLAEKGMGGPPNAIEGKNGFFQAFAGGVIPPHVQGDEPLGIDDCYMKPYPCCRHIHPAVDAVVALMIEHKLSAADIARVDIETYSIAAEHAAVGWGDFATSQLSFPFVIATAIRFGPVTLAHFGDERRADAVTLALCERIEVTATGKMNELYKSNRPATVRITTPDGRMVERFAADALGAPSHPLDDAAVGRKFMDLATSVLSRADAERLLAALWSIDTCNRIARLDALQALPVHTGVIVR